MVALARRLWRTRLNRSDAEPTFLRVVPEDLVADALEDLWRRRDALEAMLADPLAEGDRVEALREFAELQVVLEQDAETDIPVRTGDRLADYWMQRQISGEITPEDLEMTLEDLQQGRHR